MDATTPSSPASELSSEATDASLEPVEELTDEVLHWVLLGLSTAVVALACLLQVRGESDVIIPVINVPMPGTCTFKASTGIDCPGCGLTRCFVSMAHGQVGRAWRFNPVGMVFFAVVVAQVPLRIVQIWRLRRGLNELRLQWWGTWLMLGIAVGLMVQWALRLILITL